MQPCGPYCDVLVTLTCLVWCKYSEDEESDDEDDAESGAEGEEEEDGFEKIKSAKEKKKVKVCNIAEENILLSGGHHDKSTSKGAANAHMCQDSVYKHNK